MFSLIEQFLLHTEEQHMDTNQIRCLASSHIQIKKIFRDCIPADHLPRHKIAVRNLPMLLCCNLCTSDTSGEDFEVCMGHWIGIYIEEDKVTLFDSGGFINWKDNRDVKDFLKIQKKRIFYNNYQVQSLASDRCGLYVLVFFAHMSKRIGFHKFMETFHRDNFTQNDEIIWNLFKREFLSKRKMKCRAF